MIHKKEFYFIRHGQTEHNARNIIYDETDIPLNDMGRSQAQKAKWIIQKLPIKTVCYSPLKRAVETKEIITGDLLLRHQEIAGLKECTGAVWVEMVAIKEQIIHLQDGPVHQFFKQAINGINQSLSHEGPVLIVAHGGIFKVLCYGLGVHQGILVDNCIPIHFTLEEEGRWKVNYLL